MAEVIRKSLHEPEQIVEFPNLRLELVTIGDVTVAHMVNQPGWRWSTDVRPKVGGEWCQVRHVGVIISGSLGVEFPDGSSVVFKPGDVFDIPPGHDGYTVGDEPIVQIEWTGVRAWAAYGTGLQQPRADDARLRRPRQLDRARVAARRRRLARPALALLRVDAR